MGAAACWRRDERRSVKRPHPYGEAGSRATPASKGKSCTISRLAHARSLIVAPLETDTVRARTAHVRDHPGDARRTADHAWRAGPVAVPCELVLDSSRRAL